MVGNVQVALRRMARLRALLAALASLFVALVPALDPQAPRDVSAEAVRASGGEVAIAIALADSGGPEGAYPAPHDPDLLWPTTTEAVAPGDGGSRSLRVRMVLPPKLAGPGLPPSRGPPAAVA